MSTDNQFDSAISSMNSVKELIMKLGMANQKSPSVLNACRLANDHLDTAYLFLGQIAAMLREFGQEGIEAAAGKAEAAGNLHVLPGPATDAK